MNRRDDGEAGADRADDPRAARPAEDARRRPLRVAAASRACEHADSRDRQQPVEDRLTELDRAPAETARARAHAAPVEDRLGQAPERVAAEADREEDDEHARPAVLRKDDEGAARVRQVAVAAERELEREDGDDDEARSLRGEARAAEPADPGLARGAACVRHRDHRRLGSRLAEISKQRRWSNE
jgi:hypothetical protein